MNQKSILHNYVIWKEGHSPVKGELGITNIWSHQYHIFASSNDVLFCWRSNSEDCTGEMVGPLFTWTYLNEIANLINEKGISCNYELVLTIDSFSHQHTQHMKMRQKYFSKWYKLWWWKSLIMILAETLYGSDMIKHSFKRLERIPTWFGWETTAIIVCLLIDPVVINARDCYDLSSFKIILDYGWNVLILHYFPKCFF